MLEFLAKSSKDSFQLDQKKPTEVTRHFPTSFNPKNGRIVAKADRYANKIRASRNQVCCLYGATPYLTYRINLFSMHLSPSAKPERASLPVLPLR